MPTVLLDSDETAARTRLARQTLARMRLDGSGPPFRKLGARVVYDAADVEAWIAARPLRRSTSDTGSGDAAA